jgi:excisionase family DNA binding protein
MNKNSAYDSLPAFRNEEAVDTLMTKKEAARRLSLSTRTLDRLADRGVIDKIFIGSSVRFRERDVAAIIENGT